MTVRKMYQAARVMWLGYSRSYVYGNVNEQHITPVLNNNVIALIVSR